jgi:penicillin-binding protein 1A
MNDQGQGQKRNTREVNRQKFANRTPRGKMPIPAGRETKYIKRTPSKNKVDGSGNTRLARKASSNVQNTSILPASIRQSRRFKKSKRELRKRTVGRPTRSMSIVSIPAALWSGVRKGLLLVLVIILTTTAFLGGSGLGILSGYVSTAQPLEIVDVRKTYDATYIYDRYGERAAVLTGSQNILREYVPIAVVKPTYLDDAFIAIEDERFETHSGIDPKRIANAIGNVFITLGGDTHGASTITQQVVKMMSGENERSAQRKVQEWERAIELEKNLSKDEIMELFVNMVPMGNRYVGVQSAAKAYFGKDVSQLDLAECAFLAGIPNLPSIYNPATEYGRRNALRRMRITLAKMLELGKIDEYEYQQALHRELDFRSIDEAPSTGQINSYFVDAVINEVIEQLIKQRGYSRRLAYTAVFQHGLTIETTLDPDVQRAVEASFKKKELFSVSYDELPDMPQMPEAGMTVISNDPSSLGQIVALVGGYGDKKTNLGFNRATQAYRQPGSSIKPILDYAPAMDMGIITAATVLMDEPKFLDPQNPEKEWPVNHSRRHHGPVTVRYALRNSLNTTAVEVYSNMLTPMIGLSYLKRLGIDRMSEPQPAGALGGFAKGMTTVEMAGAYTALANHGLFTKPYLFTRVIDAEGNILLENKPQFEQVFSPETADIMTDLLVDTLENASWIGPYAKLGEQKAAGKTGTSDERVDRWFAGYTPYYTAAVWYGYDNAHGRRTEISEADTRCPILIWKDVMLQIHEDLEPKPFTMSENVVKRTVCSKSGQLATKYCPKTVSEYFDSLKDNVPNRSCPLHSAPAKPKIPRPSGPAPSDPEVEIGDD